MSLVETTASAVNRRFVTLFELLPSASEAAPATRVVSNKAMNKAGNMDTKMFLFKCFIVVTLPFSTG